MTGKGKCIIVSAPSGAGKTTIVKYLLNSGLDLAFSISACSRKRREGEINGKDYYFLTQEEFRNKIEKQEFVEWQEVYPGSFYGTLKSELDRIWTMGKHVIFDVDVYGGINLKKIFSDIALSVFIAPPSVEVLRERLLIRGTESEESINNRIGKAIEELSQKNKFDICIINEQLPKTQTEIYQIINSFLIKQK